MPQISLHSPIGDLTLAEEDGAIVSLDWGWGGDQVATPLLSRARAALDAYFDGDPLPCDLPLRPAGSAYAQSVWQVLCRIPPGQTRTYAEVAATAGGSARSVGQANSRNPIPLLIPCHRVVSRATLGGYSGGAGSATKRFLLELERMERSGGLV